MRGKIFGEAGDAAELRLAAGDPEDIGKGRQRMRRGVRVGALGVVDEQHIVRAGRPAPCDAPGRESCASPFAERPADAERQRAGRGAGGVLRVVQAAQRADAADLARSRCARRRRRARSSRARHRCRRPAGSSPRCAPRACRLARSGRQCRGTSRHRRRRSPCPAAARRRPAAPSPPHNARACRGDRYGLR